MGDDRVNVLCLKWGRYYSVEYVNRLYAGVKAHLRRPFRFVCVTDRPEGLVPQVESVPIPPDPVLRFHRWPNVHLKPMLFRKGFANLEGPTLFLDIDLPEAIGGFKVDRHGARVPIHLRSLPAQWVKTVWEHPDSTAQNT